MNTYDKDDPTFGDIKKGTIFQRKIRGKWKYCRKLTNNCFEYGRGFPQICFCTPKIRVHLGEKENDEYSISD